MLSIKTERRKQLITLLAIGLLCLPFSFLIDYPKSFSFNDISLYLALLTGFLGTIVLLAQFFLGTRSITGLLYQDLPWTLQIHKNLGIYGTLLIFAHPLFILYPYAQNFWYIFVPDFSSSFETSVTWGRIALYAVLIVWVCSALIRGRIKYRPWKYLHYLSYIALPLAFVHSPPIGRPLTSHRALLLYWHFLAVVYLVMIALRLRHVFGYSKQAALVTANSRVTNDAWALKLKLEQPMAVIPGQYVYLQLALKGESHPFSVVDYNPTTSELLLAFKASGPFSRKLAEVALNQTIFVDGPYGAFTHELGLQPARPRVFIAGGIGITPFVRSILAAPGNSDQYLFFCNRTLSSGVFRTQLQRRLGPRYIDVLSQVDAHPDESNTVRGYINGQIIQRFVSRPTDYDYYICGPTKMMAEASSELRSLGVGARNIHMEAFNF